MNIKISTKGSENKVKDIPQKVIQKDIRHGDGQHQTMKTLEKQHRKFHSQLTVSSSRKKKKKTGKKLTKKNTRAFLRTKEYA